MLLQYVILERACLRIGIATHVGAGESFGWALGLDDTLRYSFYVLINACPSFANLIERMTSNAVHARVLKIIEILANIRV